MAKPYRLPDFKKLYLETNDYGSRAAAGVILVTTKRASDKELSLTYNGEFGWEIPTAEPEVVGVQRFLEMANELRYTDNPDGGKYQAYSEDQVNNWVKNNEKA